MIDLDSLDGIIITDDPSEQAHSRSPEEQQQQQLLLQQSPVSMQHSNLQSSESVSDPSLLAGGSISSLTCMLITANVGTIFEESALLELWFQQLKSYLTKIKPQFVAIHCQEVGGKNYESSMKHVSNFTDKIIADKSVIGDYSRVRIFLDENFESLEKFTALGSLYLVHDSVQAVELYNFKTAQYETVEGVKVYNGNSTNKNAEHVEKVKFPQELFPDCRWSRKGFMRTRWLFNSTQPLDLVNIHLFHDASNIVAMETNPSPYAQTRQKALEFTLKTISRQLPEARGGQLEASQVCQKNEVTSRRRSYDISDEVPLFIFGDFNFRLNTSKVIQRITEGVSPVVKQCKDSNDVKFIYHRRDDCKSDSNVVSDGREYARKDDDGNSNYIDGGAVVMTVGKKLFDCENLDETFRAAKNTEWLLELDNELDSFRQQLFEFKISFSPSYPFKEDETGGYSYMKTRCPAWCDRILFNAAGCRLIHGSHKLGKQNDITSEKKLQDLQSRGEVIYRLMGNSVPMGDHKPVLLYCRLSLDSASRDASGLLTYRAGTEIQDSSDAIESTTM